MEQVPNQNEVESIKSEIAAMCQEDQAMRKRALENDGVIESEWDDKIDVRNTNRMKKIIEMVGWPTISRFGAQTSNDAWLLVQHADHDVEFQKHCLELMKQLPEEETIKIYLAYLEDRVAVNEKRPQIYGTQFWEHDGVYEPRPIWEPEKVNERRASIGLETLEEYKAAILKFYNKNQ